LDHLLEIAYWMQAGWLAIGGEVCTEPLVKGKVIELGTWNYVLELIKKS
jgi:hypothetical protein